MGSLFFKQLPIGNDALQLFSGIELLSVFETVTVGGREVVVWAMHKV